MALTETAGRSEVDEIVDLRRSIDIDAAIVAVRDLLVALGEDVDTEALRESPRRVAHAFVEFLTPHDFAPTSFPNEEGYDELVLVRNIPFTALCQHHLLPFSGVAHVGYLPADRVIGLSKLGRVVELFSRRLQIQERMTKQIVDWLDRSLAPKGVGVVLDAEHSCMTLRGVRAPGARTVTSALHGNLRSDLRTRDEFLALTRSTVAPS